MSSAPRYKIKSLLILLSNVSSLTKDAFWLIVLNVEDLPRERGFPLRVKRGHVLSDSSYLIIEPIMRVEGEEGINNSYRDFDILIKGKDITIRTGSIGGNIIVPWYDSLRPSRSIEADVGYKSYMGLDGFIKNWSSWGKIDWDLGGKTVNNWAMTLYLREESEGKYSGKSWELAKSDKRGE